MSETLNVLGAPMIVKEEAGLFVAEHPVPPGYFVPPHRHEADDELLYVMEGRLTLISEAGETEAAAGTCARFARGDLHGFRNDTDATVRLLVMAQPGVQAAEMFRHFDRAAAKGPLTPDDVMGIAGQYGVRFG
ncbi:cupin domain-containing protein [Reyranella sp.]|uniref:cupin domain-containing protein n=1 Tax=Reyranella sp. TaxID=1929291 RepID=UPI0012253B56|nr:cupin domain-containing protein [Reyranella sp.]TAJ84085.1 MAG: cupin domain-containing protein [Reyranella sp.]